MRGHRSSSHDIHAAPATQPQAQDVSSSPGISSADAGPRRRRSSYLGDELAARHWLRSVHAARVREATSRPRGRTSRRQLTHRGGRDWTTGPHEGATRGPMACELSERRTLSEPRLRIFSPNSSWLSSPSPPSSSPSSVSTIIYPALHQNDGSHRISDIIKDDPTIALRRDYSRSRHDRKYHRIHSLLNMDVHHHHHHHQRNCNSDDSFETSVTSRDQHGFPWTSLRLGCCRFMEILLTFVLSLCGALSKTQYTYTKQAYNKKVQLVNVNMLGSMDTVRILISSNATVKDTIQLALKQFVLQEQLPPNEGNPDAYHLHFSSFSFQSLDSEEQVQSLGARNFVLCPKQLDQALKFSNGIS